MIPVMKGLQYVWGIQPLEYASVNTAPDTRHRISVFLHPLFTLPCRWRAYWAVLGQHTGGFMLYAILCYNDEDVVWSWTKEEDAAVMGRLAVVRERLAPIMGPSARLLPTTAPTTVRQSPYPIAIDGHYAETRQ